MADLTSKFRKLLQTVHPDKNPHQEELANKLLKALNLWREDAKYKISVSTYGDSKRVVKSVPERILPRTELKLGKQVLVLNEAFAEGTFSIVRYTEFNDPDHFLYTKISRSPGDNDLLEREYRTLKALWTPITNSTIEAFHSVYRNYVPFPVKTFTVMGTDNKKHRANLLSTSLGERYTAQQLRENHYPKGVPPEHCWWILRRLLSVLMMVHQVGYVHGAITPDHLLVLPDPQHGIMLLDWCYSTKIGETVPAINNQWKEFIAPEVSKKEPVTTTTDIFSVASTIIYLLGGNPQKHEIPDCVKPEIRAILLQCLDPIQKRRPQDAGKLYDDLGTLMEPRRYVKLEVAK
jgi:hypothetical protein